MSAIAIEKPVSRGNRRNQYKNMKKPHSFASPVSVKTCPVTPSSTARRRSSAMLSSVSSKSKRASLLAKMVKGLSAPPLPMEEKKNENKKELSPRQSRQSSLRNLLARQESKKSFIEVDTTIMMMMDKFSFMSYQFPMTQKAEKVVFKKLGLSDLYSSNDDDILIETTGGDIIGSIDYSSSAQLGIRIIQDAAGRPCAIIRRTQDESILGGSTSIFQVYGTKPCFSAQNPSNDRATNGFYLWAEIKNSKAIGGGKFIMHTNQSSETNYTAQRFGGLFSKEKSRGFSFLDGDEKECTKMITLKDRGSKGIVMAPNCDMCLMLAFCAVVDEMVENILI